MGNKAGDITVKTKWLSFQGNQWIVMAGALFLVYWVFFGVDLWLIETCKNAENLGSLETIRGFLQNYRLIIHAFVIWMVAFGFGYNSSEVKYTGVLSNMEREQEFTRASRGMVPRVERERTQRTVIQEDKEGGDFSPNGTRTSDIAPGDIF